MGEEDESVGGGSEGGMSEDEREVRGRWGEEQGDQSRRPARGGGQKGAVRRVGARKNRRVTQTVSQNVTAMESLSAVRGRKRGDGRARIPS